VASRLWEQPQAQNLVYVPTFLKVPLELSALKFKAMHFLYFNDEALLRVESAYLESRLFELLAPDGPQRTPSKLRRLLTC
jgi:hypothetical protein